MRKKLRKSQRRAALDLLRRARKARNCELESVAQEQAPRAQSSNRRQVHATCMSIALIRGKMGRPENWKCVCCGHSSRGDTERQIL